MNYHELTICSLDGKGTFRPGLARIRERVEERFYVSVATFSTDLGTVFSSGIGMSNVADTAGVQSQIIVDRSRKDLSAEQKEKRKLAKRIIKAIQPALEDAMRKESELYRKPFEKELRDLDMLLETSISSRRDSMTGSLVEYPSEEDAEEHKPKINGQPSEAMEVPQPGELSNQPTSSEALTNGNIDPAILGDIPAQNPDPVPELTNGTTSTVPVAVPSKEPNPGHECTPESSNPNPTVNGITHEAPTSNNVDITKPTNPAPTNQDHHEPPTPPLSSASDYHTALSAGSIPWYMEPFDPVGTTIFEERWTGREVARGMSEELSDMDEEELDGLVDVDVDVEMDLGDGPEGAVGVRGGDGATGEGGPVQRKKNGKLKKRWRGYR